MSEHRKYKKLTESLKLLSLPYSEQAKFIPDFADIPFEVIDTFENAFLFLPELIENKQLSVSGLACLLRLHNMINLISSDPRLKDFTETEFESAKEWAMVRELARTCLTTIGEPIADPDPEYL